jgi:hypothetical protein
VNEGVPCEGYTKPLSTRYYYDVRLKKCKEFKYKGCGHDGLNSNSFVTRDDCEWWCEVSKGSIERLNDAADGVDGRAKEAKGSVSGGGMNSVSTAAASQADESAVPTTASIGTTPHPNPTSKEEAGHAEEQLPAVITTATADTTATVDTTAHPPNSTSTPAAEGYCASQKRADRALVALMDDYVNPIQTASSELGGQCAAGESTPEAEAAQQVLNRLLNKLATIHLFNASALLADFAKPPLGFAFKGVDSCGVCKANVVSTRAVSTTGNWDKEKLW